MIDIRVGAKERTPVQRADDAFAAKQVLSEVRFIRLIEYYADELVSRWARSPTPEAREEAYQMLEGFRGFVRFLSVVVDRGATPQGGAGNSESR